MSHSGIRASPSTDQDRWERRWAIVRLTLGILQMTGAALALGLLAASGVTRAALTVAVLTGLMTTLSVCCSGGVHRGQAPAIAGLALRDARTCDQILDPPAGGAGDGLGSRGSGLCCRL